LGKVKIKERGRGGGLLNGATSLLGASLGISLIINAY
jgi:hypothetical protein